MVNTNKYMAKFLFLHLLDFLKVLYFFPAFFLSCFLSFFLKSFIFFLMHWSSLRSLLRTYEWSTCRNPSIVFTDAKSATEKERRHLHISNNAPNLSPKILHKHYFQFLWDGYNIQEKWKTPWKVMQNWAGGGGGGVGKKGDDYGRCASDKSSYLDRTNLVNKRFILWPNYRGFDSQQFVLLLFSILRVGRLPRHWFISFSRLPFPASFASTLNVPMVFLSFARNPTSN